MLRLVVGFTLVVVLAVPGRTSPHASQHSKLWGASAQAHKAGGVLPDFSWAGYHAGEEPPTVAVSANVRELGARGDGQSDDTVAFQRALDEAPNGAVLVPKGRYRLTRQLNITRSGVTLRGQGSGAEGTVLQFASSLADLQGLATLATVNKLSWSGGLVQVLPKGVERKLTPVTTAARRGDRILHVADAGSIRPGDILVLRLAEDSQRTLERHLIGEPGTAGAAQLQSTCAAQTLDWTFLVEAVKGNDLVLSQPLRTDVSLSWAPAVWRMPFIAEVGIEHLAIEFPTTIYPGHHRERGYNAIELSGNVVNAWIRDVAIRNCDSGIFVGRRSKWLTITGVQFLSSRPGDAKGNQGHHGVALSACSDVLAMDMTFESEFIHELTITHRAMGNVFAGPVRAKGLDLDHHRDAPFENLFENLTGDVHLQEGGSACYGPAAGVRNTYWAVDHMSVPSWIGAAAVVVGDVVPPPVAASSSLWIERVPDLEPRELRAAQRLRRIEQMKNRQRGGAVSR